MRSIGWLFVLAVVLVALTGTSALGAAKYPERAVMVIVPNPPGGLNDLVGRALVEAAKPYFPQPLTILNRPGAGGAVGMTEMFQAMFQAAYSQTEGNCGWRAQIHWCTCMAS